MNRYINTIAKSAYISSMILAGILLFIAISAVGINHTILSPELHERLFEKNDIYYQTYNVIKTSMTDFIDGIKRGSPKDYEDHKDIFIMLEKSITPEMVNSNLDNIREDAFLFFNGKRVFLPDIYLRDFAKYTPVDTKPKAEDSKLSAENISKIDKINLSAILLYINRSDITDYFTIIKLFNHVMISVPVVSFLLLVFLLLIGCVSGKSFPDVIKWGARVFIISGALSLLSGICLLIYSRFFLPDSIRFVTMSLPVKADVIIAYFRDCVENIVFYLMACSIAAVILSFITGKVGKRLLCQSITEITEPSEEERKSYRVQRIIKYSAISTAFIFVTVNLYAFAVDFKADYEANGFAEVVARFNNTNMVKEVISAKDDAIYSLQIKLVETKYGTPLTNTPIQISGSSDLLKKYFNVTSPTDSEGIAKFTLDEGTFRLSFIQSGFPAGFQIPSPFFFDLKTAGTTIITVYVDKLPETENWGIAEIEILDKDNIPIPGLQLGIQDTEVSPGNPDNVFSISNSEGIAIFKLNEGNYTAVFSEASLEGKYKAPSPLNIALIPNSTSRYTIRMVDVEDENSQSKLNRN